jgi:hypothetical protein
LRMTVSVRADMGGSDGRGRTVLLEGVPAPAATTRTKAHALLTAPTSAVRFAIVAGDGAVTSARGHGRVLLQRQHPVFNRRAGRARQVSPARISFERCGGPVARDRLCTTAPFGVDLLAFMHDAQLKHAKRQAGGELDDARHATDCSISR